MAWHERQEAWFDSCRGSIFSAMMIRQQQQQHGYEMLEASTTTATATT